MSLRPWTLVLVLSLAACGGGALPTGPSGPPAPGPAPGPAASPTPAPTPTPSPGPMVLRSASVRGANGHSSAGTAQVVLDAGRYRLEFLSDFRVDTGSIDIYLSRSSSGRVDTSSDLNLGSLKARTGAQSYSMPNAASGYDYVVLWCRPFRIPIGLGVLR